MSSRRPVALNIFCIQFPWKIPTHDWCHSFKYSLILVKKMKFLITVRVLSELLLWKIDGRSSLIVSQFTNKLSHYFFLILNRYLYVHCNIYKFKNLYTYTAITRWNTLLEEIQFTGQFNKIVKKKKKLLNSPKILV